MLLNEKKLKTAVQNIGGRSKLSTERLPVWGFHTSLAFFRVLKTEGFVLTLPQQSLPRIPPNISYQPHLFCALKVGGLLQQSLPYIGKLSTRKAYHEHLPYIGLSPQPCLFRALKVGCFALALPWQSLPSQSFHFRR